MLYALFNLASSGSERKRVAATENGWYPPLPSGEPEPKAIETQVACTNVPKESITVADALAALHAAATRKDQARTIRRALLAALAALESEE